MAKVHKGWLKTRNGEYFSPNTLSDSVYALDGNKYDDVVKGYVQNAKIELETTQMAIQQQIIDLYDKLKNFDGSDSDVFYVVDSNNNIILQVDQNGSHSVDFKSLNYSLEELGKSLHGFEQSVGSVRNYIDNATNTLQANIDQRLKNFDGSDSDVLYITDSNGNIIAQVDDTGVHSINFTTSQYDVNNMLSSLDTRLIKEISDRAIGDNAVKEYVDSTSQTILQSLTQTDNKVNTLIGSDSNKSVRTIANEELAAQLLSGKADADFKTLQQLAAWLEDHPEDVAAINLAIQVIQGQLGGFEKTTNAVKNYIDNATNTLQQDMNNRLKNFDGSDSDTLYIVDKFGNKIAQVDSVGVSSINFITNEYNMNNELKSLGERITAEANTRAVQDEAYYKKHQDELNTHILWDTQEHTTLQNNINANTQLINSVDERLDEKIDTTNNTINTRIDNEVSTLNNSIGAAVQLHKDELNTHHVWDVEQHTTLQNNINDNRQFTVDARQELLDKIKFYDNEGIDGSDTLYIVDGNGYKLAQFDVNGLKTTYVEATDFTAGNGFKFSGAMFYNLQGFITTFPDGI